MNIKKLNEEIEKILNSKPSSRKKFRVKKVCEETNSNQGRFEGEISDFQFKEEPQVIAYSDGYSGFSSSTSVGQLQSGEWLIFENDYRSGEEPVATTRQEVLEAWVDQVCSDFEYSDDFFEALSIQDSDLEEIVYNYFGDRDDEYYDEDEEEY